MSDRGRVERPTERRQIKEDLDRKIGLLRSEGVCYICRDLETGEFFGQQPTIYDDDRLRVVLALFPRMKGHTIVIFKPHREDISEVTGDEASEIFQLCVRLVNAIKRGLDAEKVYLNTMCDGEINHLHIQLFPRYAGERIGSSRFVAPRGPLIDGKDTAGRIRDALK
jgi:diadenosine tetraphosphate (Ap4A) HIT family hydrolase